MAQIIDGKAISQAIKDEVKREVEGLSGQGITVTLAVVQVGSNPAAELNGRADVNGILVQLPLPSHMNEDAVIGAISPEKDVDGFHP